MGYHLWFVITLLMSRKAFQHLQDAPIWSYYLIEIKGISTCMLWNFGIWLHAKFRCAFLNCYESVIVSVNYDKAISLGITIPVKILVKITFCCIILKGRHIFILTQERKPELTSEIMAFRDYLLSSTISDTLDVWELKGIWKKRVFPS